MATFFWAVTHGRILDNPEQQLKTALRWITETFGYPMQLAPTHNVLIAESEPQQRRELDQLWQEYQVIFLRSRSLLQAWAPACLL